jgi:hypothetical protein
MAPITIGQAGELPSAPGAVGPARSAWASAARTLTSDAASAVRPERGRVVGAGALRALGAPARAGGLAGIAVPVPVVEVAAGGGCGVTAAVVVARVARRGLVAGAAVVFAGARFLPSGVTVTCALSPP